MLTFNIDITYYNTSQGRHAPHVSPLLTLPPKALDRIVFDKRIDAADEIDKSRAPTCECTIRVVFLDTLTLPMTGSTMPLARNLRTRYAVVHTAISTAAFLSTYRINNHLPHNQQYG